MIVAGADAATVALIVGTLQVIALAAIAAWVRVKTVHLAVDCEKHGIQIATAFARLRAIENEVKASDEGAPVHPADAPG